MHNNEVDKELANLLNEAMDLLDNVKGNLALFEKQQYWNLKRKVEHLKQLNTELQHSLYKVTCSDKN